MINGCSLCDGHAKTLCDLIDDRNMGHLVQRMGGAKAQRDDGLEFCPLQVAEVAIYNVAIRALGTRAWMANPEGTDRCYLCEEDRRARRSGAGDALAARVVDGVLEYAYRERFLERPRFVRRLFVGGRAFSLVG